MNFPTIQPEFHKPFAVQLDIRTYERDGVHIARCDALKMSDQGESENQAVSNLALTLILYFETCRKHGTLFKILDEQGVPYEGPGGLEPDHQAVPIPILKWGQGHASQVGSER